MPSSSLSSLSGDIDNVLDPDTPVPAAGQPLERQDLVLAEPVYVLGGSHLASQPRLIHPSDLLAASQPAAQVAAIDRAAARNEAEVAPATDVPVLFENDPVTGCNRHLQTFSYWAHVGMNQHGSARDDRFTCGWTAAGIPDR